MPENGQLHSYTRLQPFNLERFKLTSFNEYKYCVRRKPTSPIEGGQLSRPATEKSVFFEAAVSLGGSYSYIIIGGFRKLNSQIATVNPLSLASCAVQGAAAKVLLAGVQGHDSYHL
jgi:hypothetical protein